jgi:hypothetical protein
MAIVLPCSMTPSEFAAAGREVEMPRPHCPNCSARMSFWGFYSRPLRIGDEIRLLVHRARCSSCRRTHALIPDFVVPGRLDGIEVIGPGIEQMANEATTLAVAQRAGVPYTTARGWRRRFVSRAELLASGFLAATVALGDLVPRLPAGVVEIALCAIKAVGSASRRRLGAVGDNERIANLVVGGHLLSTNTNPPWICG